MIDDRVFALSGNLVDTTMVLFMEKVLEYPLERYQRFFIMAYCADEKVKGVKVI